MPAAAGGGAVQLTGDTAPPPWPQAAVSLSLFNYNTATGASSSSLVGHHHHQLFTAAPTNQQLEVPSATASLLQPFQLRSSKYLGPVRELLSEFCSLLEGDLHAMVDKGAANNNKATGNKWDDVEALSSSGLWGSPSLSSMDLMELERSKVRLLTMVEEVDRRYRRYREQIRSVEVSFDAVAGAGAAEVYTSLARRAMSRHFRCLRDALVAQLRAVKKKAMGSSSDSQSQREGSSMMAAAGATKGETPRLRVLDQCLRQQRAFQQPAALDNYPWRPQRGLPEQAVAPPPGMALRTLPAPVSNWFINARVRLWKPMIEEMYKEEVDQQSEANQQNPSDTIVKAERTTTNLGGESYHQQQQLGTAVGNHQNSMISSSSIVTDGDQHHLFHSSYPTNMVHGSSHSSAVSLTLGLQQQPFASSMMQQQERSAGLMYEGHEEQQSVLPYTNLLGSQLLHDFVG
ncbi:hypothetical protein PR202_gb18196 [Eleusine coracana subsp. coracana]|uniref:POX domain-containing protein n=1 Tax=Eleusine coracana subsp. coracana TaxID=191504 RepID=A0AAV5F4N2_ELECO|nr:hypothetical protein PR202_gb18196 [Eleusine coracana subsp. coracana]